MKSVDNKTPLTQRPAFVSRVASELGIHSIWSSSTDTKLLCLQRFVRLFAYGGSTLILALYLSSLGISDGHIGLFMTLTLLGDVVISFLLTLVADGLGRRRILMLGSVLMAASGVVFALSGNYWILVAASIFGVISPSGNEIGPFRAIEESTLAQLTPSAIRSDIFAWYTLLGSAGAAFGNIVCGWLVQLMIAPGRMGDVAAYRVIFGIYAALGLVKLALAFMLSDSCEPEPPKQGYQEVVEMDDALDAEGLLSDSDDEHDDNETSSTKHEPQNSPKPKQEPQTPLSPTAPPTPPIRSSILPTISPESRRTLLSLSLLFAIDSLASGLVPASWITYFFNRKFSLPEGQIGTLFFVTNLIGAVSHLVASSLAKRIGLIKTMVLTHLPSAIFLALIPLPRVSWLAMLFLILRSCLQHMDQAPRQAFLSAAVLPAERTAVMGMVNVVKTLSQSGGPVATGFLAGVGKFWIAFLVAGSMKAAYDLAMLRMFLGVKSREEREEEAQRGQGSDEEAGGRGGRG